jgi:hypothetical protein
LVVPLPCNRLPNDACAWKVLDTGGVYADGDLFS